MSLPGMSIIAATRNRAPQLKRMLDQVLEDTYPYLEIIIVDGASTDGTVDLLKSYSDKRLRWLSEPDGGEYYAVNKAVALSTKEIIKPMTDDDLIRPGAILTAGSYLENHPEVEILFGQSVIWDTRGGKATKTGGWLAKDKSTLTMSHWLRGTTQAELVASFIRRRVFEQIGSFATEYIAGDTEFAMRAVAAGVKMDVCAEVFIDYHITGANTILTKRLAMNRDRFVLNWRYGGFREKCSAAYEYYVRQMPDRTGFHPKRWLRNAGLMRSPHLDA